MLGLHWPHDYSLVVGPVRADRASAALRTQGPKPDCAIFFHRHHALAIGAG
jgi:hypothetical protein